MFLIDYEKRTGYLSMENDDEGRKSRISKED